jgi:hypothetical protein
MKKLTLDLDALRVESYATGDTAERRGTVRAHDDTLETEFCTQEHACTRFCTHARTCAPSCEQNTCEPLC